MENSIRRVPAIENAEVVRLLNGPEGFTPDGEFLLGPTSVKGFWVACAFCAHGLAGAGGIGKVMAEWIVDGNPEWDMWRLDVRRFGPNYNSLDYTVARTFETYTQYYDIHFPGEERLSKRNVRMSPTYFDCAISAVTSAKRWAGNARTGSGNMRNSPRTVTNRKAGRVTIGPAPLVTNT
jgi:hypothetical protein